MKRLIIHIGMHKTGTTSIQNTLFYSAEILYDLGVYYPICFDENHSTSIVPLFLEKPENDLWFSKKGFDTSEKAQNKIKELREKWESEFKSFQESSCSQFIISGEGLANLSKKQTEKLKQFVSLYFSDIKIISYFRDANSYVKSALQQRVKVGLITINEYRYFTERCFKVKKVISNYYESFGQENVIIKVFKKDFFKNGNLIDDFFEGIGLGSISQNTVALTRKNESLGHNSVVFLSELNKNHPSLVNSTIKLARRGIIDEIYGSIKDKPFNINITFSKEEVDRINEEIDYINKLLPPEQSFEKIEYIKDKTNISNAEDIPIKYYVDLIKEYNRSIEKLLSENDRLRFHMKQIFSNSNY